MTLRVGCRYPWKNNEIEDAGKPRIVRPEHQFVSVLIERKRAQLAAKDFSDMQKRDVVLQVTINFDFP